MERRLNNIKTWTLALFLTFHGFDKAVIQPGGLQKENPPLNWTAVLWIVIKEHEQQMWYIGITRI